MSVTTEKNAVLAAFVSVLTGAVVGTTSANVGMWVLPEPNSLWPFVVLTRTHYTVTETAAGGGAQKGNDDNDPNLYHWAYYDTLTSVSGSTVDATMDAHDAFLEALITYCSNQRRQYLPDGNGVGQVNGFGETITSDATPGGPFALTAGSSTLLSEGTITVKGLYRPPT